AALAAFFALAARVPAERIAQRFGDEDEEVGMRTRRMQAAARATPARTVRKRARILFAQPSLGERERELELANVARTVEKQGVRCACRERRAPRRDEPRQVDRRFGADTRGLAFWHRRAQAHRRRPSSAATASSI